MTVIVLLQLNCIASIVADLLQQIYRRIKTPPP